MPNNNSDPFSQCTMTEFIGGPLDGPRPTHPGFNFVMRVEGNPEGCYLYQEGAYHWMPNHERTWNQAP